MQVSSNFACKNSVIAYSVVKLEELFLGSQSWENSTSANDKEIKSLLRTWRCHQLWAFHIPCWGLHKGSNLQIPWMLYSWARREFGLYYKSQSRARYFKEVFSMYIFYCQSYMILAIAKSIMVACKNLKSKVFEF